MSTSTDAGTRHLSIDAVRGFAVLGILLMNIVGMGLPSFAYVTPTHAGGSEGADFWTWAINNVLTDGKMRALFTMLFGASTILIAERAESGPLSPAATHYRRMLWLLPFGLAHATLFWFGEVLVLYAAAGLVIFPFRKLSPRAQLLIGAAILLALLAKNVWQSGVLESLHATATAPGASPEAIKAWQSASMAVEAAPGAKEAELAGFGGDFLSALHARLSVLMVFYVAIFPTEMLPEAIGQMFVGMALFRLGFFTLGWSHRAYGLMIAFGYLICVPATAALTVLIARSNFDPLVLHEMTVWQQVTRPFIALAHAAGLLMMVRTGLARGLVSRLAAAGQMAFSNYIGTSVITSTLFCGYGFGLYGQLSRAELLWVVAGAWAFMLIWSPLWLARFRYGPLEWAWRSLVQWQVQPMAKATA